MVEERAPFPEPSRIRTVLLDKEIQNICFINLAAILLESILAQNDN
jgi:hypothetical protein